MSNDVQEARLSQRRIVEVAPPWSWAIVLTSVALIAALVVVGVLGRIDVVVRGSGVIRPAEGERAIVSLRDGTIAYLLPAGTHVTKGQTLVRLQSLSAEAELRESVREEIAATSDKQRLEAIDTRRNESLKTSLERMAASNDNQAAELRTNILLEEERLRRADQLRAGGLLSSDAVLDRQEHLRQLRQELAAISDSKLRLKQELATVNADSQSKSIELETREREAQHRRNELNAATAELVVTSPIGGVLDSVNAHQGEWVPKGYTIGRVVPIGVPSEILAFVPEGDARGIAIGDAVQLQLSQYPVTEFGAITGKVIRISGDVVSTAAVKAALGDDVPLPDRMYGVEIVIVPPVPVGVVLRPGASAVARFVVRRRRPIDLVMQLMRGSR